ncbi:hypothetical protein NAPIS_ORF00659 [Vairimorpha apis BRL 01]|uniref:Uncharacterized protein n=1 Tax=Vairimorpha apis BRL 01 TaxID=1037528 RepID=T0ML72_9MICR|nr:hypothetical protein NAPIS_ORF00659 [Vairimorpha apis BRL 01]
MSFDSQSEQIINLKYVEAISCKEIFDCIDKIVNFKNNVKFKNNPIFIYDKGENNNYFKMKKFSGNTFNRCFYNMDINRYYRFLVRYFTMKLGRIKFKDLEYIKTAKEEITAICPGAIVEYKWIDPNYNKNDENVLEQIFNEFKNDIPKEWIHFVPDYILSSKNDFNYSENKALYCNFIPTLQKPLTLNEGFSNEKDNISEHDKEIYLENNTKKIVKTEIIGYFTESNNNKKENTLNMNTINIGKNLSDVKNYELDIKTDDIKNNILTKQKYNVSNNNENLNTNSIDLIVDQENFNIDKENNLLIDLNYNNENHYVKEKINVSNVDTDIEKINSNNEKNVKNKDVSTDFNDIKEDVNLIYLNSEENFDPFYLGSDNINERFDEKNNKVDDFDTKNININTDEENNNSNNLISDNINSNTDEENNNSNNLNSDDINSNTDEENNNSNNLISDNINSNTDEENNNSNNLISDNININTDEENNNSNNLNSDDINSNTDEENNNSNNLISDNINSNTDEENNNSNNLSSDDINSNTDEENNNSNNLSSDDINSNTDEENNNSNNLSSDDININIDYLDNNFKMVNDSFNYLNLDIEKENLNITDKNQININDFDKSNFSKNETIHLTEKLINNSFETDSSFFSENLIFKDNLTDLNPTNKLVLNKTTVLMTEAFVFLILGGFVF